MIDAASSEALVEVDIADHVAVVAINRPRVRNAIDLATAEQLAAALDRADEDSDVRVIVLTGRAGFFCAGMDLKAFAATGARPITASRGAFGIVERPPLKPTIAAIEGAALGGGLEIALSADLIVAGDDARFGLPEVRRGLVATAGGVLRLPDRIPYASALELILTGADVSAAEAQRLGLVNRVVPAGSALTEARTLASTIAANAPMAVRAAKAVVVASRDWPAEEAFARQRVITDPVRASRDAKEGALAFAEKRPAVWRNA